jgi:hypothetical protein
VQGPAAFCTLEAPEGGEGRVGPALSVFSGNWTYERAAAFGFAAFFAFCLMNCSTAS